MAQLTGQASCNKVCLSALVTKRYRMGLRQEIKRSTLADANETGNSLIHAEFAQRLIVQARKLYAGENSGIELENTAYAESSDEL